MTREIPDVPNWIGGGPRAAAGGWLDKCDPHDGTLLCRFADSGVQDADAAIAAAQAAFAGWAATTPVARGQILLNLAAAMKHHAAELERCITREAGKPPQDAAGEVAAAIQVGEYFAGEGMRLYGRSLTSGMPGKYSHTVRQPRGVVALIVPANMPLANIAWKVFPALVCGNSVVLKSAEDAPLTAWTFLRLAREAGIPDGVLNLLHGRGDPAGAALVADERVTTVSFTGSSRVGRAIAAVAGQRLARVSLELGGKNPLVVCDDADLEQAVRWALLSAFSNAGQRCAAGSRVLVFEGVYEAFRERFVAGARALRLGVEPGCDLGPLINRRQQQAVIETIAEAGRQGGRILCGGGAPQAAALAAGAYLEPTIVEDLPPGARLACEEVFAPVATLHRVASLSQALELANATPYGLTAAIHTRSVDRAMWFAQRVRSGVANVNLGTYGSEPHMPFGGFGASGNGSREPGVEALDVYSELKNISFLVRDSFL